MEEEKKRRREGGGVGGCFEFSLLLLEDGDDNIDGICDADADGQVAEIRVSDRRGEAHTDTFVAKGKLQK